MLPLNSAQPRRLVTLALRLEQLRPGVFGVGQDDADEIARLVLRSTGLGLLDLRGRRTLGRFHQPEHDSWVDAEEPRRGHRDDAAEAEPEAGAAAGPLRPR